MEDSKVSTFGGFFEVSFMVDFRVSHLQGFLLMGWPP